LFARFPSLPSFQISSGFRRFPKNGSRQPVQNLRAGIGKAYMPAQLAERAKTLERCASIADLCLKAGQRNMISPLILANKSLEEVKV
jgi:hypothetical protein